jgi:16S rRNA (adenine1518-N6/adenine1519-N6)-dimethyltransferase
MEDLTSPRLLRETLTGYGLAPRKRFGQNFLIDANLRDKIVAAAELCPGDLAVEIGAGAGALTAKLAATGAAVLAVEIDPGLTRLLQEKMPPSPGLVIVTADVLRLDLAETVARSGFSGRPCVAVANLPYCITTPVIFRLLETVLPWRRMVFLVQKEVAERIVAAPGTKDYGLLSVSIRHRAVPEIVTILPPSAFWPPPKVHSALLRLSFQASGPTLPKGAEDIMAGLARAAFGQRRKMIANACRAWSDALGLGAGFIPACRAAGIDPGLRGENLTVEDFRRLAVEIDAMLNTTSPFNST